MVYNELLQFGPHPFVHYPMAYMLKQRILVQCNSQCLPYLLPYYFPNHNYNSIQTVVSLPQSSSFIIDRKSTVRQSLVLFRARRRAIYDDEDEDEDENNNNLELAMLEFYSQSVRNEALLVKALVDEEEVEVLIFKVNLIFDFND